MKPIDYILIAVIAAFITGVSIYVIVERKNAAKEAVDTYQLQELKAKGKILAHESDSINDELAFKNRLLLYSNHRLTVERDSFMAISTRHINQLDHVYQNKINRLSVLPDDSLHSVFANQLSAGGSN